MCVYVNYANMKDVILHSLHTHIFNPQSHTRSSYYVHQNDVCVIINATSALIASTLLLFPNLLLFPPISFIIIPKFQLVCFFVFSVMYHVGRSFGLLSVSLYVFVDTNWRLNKDSQQSCNSLHFFCTNINNHICIHSYHLPSSFFKSNILSLMPIKSLLLFSCYVISNSFATPRTVTHQAPVFM